MGFIDTITDPNFIKFLSTFGLAVVLVLYFILWRDPKRDKDWRQRYDKLTGNYDSLSKSYNCIERNLVPESREVSHDQAVKLAELGLDRDLYKLYYYMCEKVDGRRPESVATFIAESIGDTNKVWTKFTSPFPRVPCISDLYGVYMNNGGTLKLELEKIFETDVPSEEKKDQILHLLFDNAVNMKGEFQIFLKNLNDGKEITPYNERAVAAKN